jgi:hypothetical protein
MEEELKELVSNSILDQEDKNFFLENIDTMSDFQKMKLEEIVNDLKKD